MTRRGFNWDLGIYGAIGLLTYVVSSPIVPAFWKFVAGCGLSTLVAIKAKLSNGKDSVGGNTPDPKADSGE